MLIVITILLLLPLGQGAPAPNKSGAPTVTLGSGTTIIGATLAGVDSFKGISYAQPPTGPLRLKPPQPLNGSLGTITTTLIPKSCPQFFSQANTGALLTDGLSDLLDSPLFQKITNAGEDCLNINVQRPATATADSKLPIVYWMFGGGFEFGSTTIYDGTELIRRQWLKKKI